jgi:hypothetical protein
MQEKLYRWAQLLALSELASALLLPGAYLFPFVYAFRAENFLEPGVFLGALPSILLVVIPAIALVGLVRMRRWAFWGLYLSPLVSFLFGVGSVPLIAYLVPAPYVRMAFLAILNLTAIALAIWLSRKMEESLMDIRRVRGIPNDA